MGSIFSPTYWWSTGIRGAGGDVKLGPFSSCKGIWLRGSFDLKASSKPSKFSFCFPRKFIATHKQSSASLNSELTRDVHSYVFRSNPGQFKSIRRHSRDEGVPASCGLELPCSGHQRPLLFPRRQNPEVFLRRAAERYVSSRSLHRRRV